VSETLFKALVVDDDRIARRTVMWALSQENFLCTPSVDGVDALEKSNRENYDLIVTDLRMPNMHGHSLITLLFEKTPPPKRMVVVHSSVDNPQLTKDLMLRGVDDIIYKPTNYAAFAAKMRGALLRRRLQPAPASATNNDAAFDALPKSESIRRDVKVRMTEADFDRRLDDVVQLLPISKVSLEIRDHLSREDFDANSLTKIIEGDAVLIAEVLRIANRGLNSRTQGKILKLNEAVARLGSKRIGEISLAVGALDGMAKLVLPWFNRDIALRRSLAGCKAAKIILELQRMEHNEEGLFFSALMYPLTRVVVGCAFSSSYESMIADSRLAGTPLRALESERFPRTPASATAIVLQRIGVPAEVCMPLSYADLPLKSIMSLAEPIRRSVQVLLAAIRCGELAVNHWNPWEDEGGSQSEAILSLVIGPNHGDVIDRVRNELEESLRG